MTEIHSGPQAISMGVDRLRDQRLVAFPTETVYGLGANALNAQAVDHVFSLKGRPSNNPLIVHVSGIEMAKTVVQEWTPEAEKIAQTFWPGPVTMVLEKGSSVPSNVCADGSTVAVRCPAHPCALALIEAFGYPIVGPSANPSGWISPTTPEHVVDGFKDADLLVIDGGHCRAGIESTVVDLTQDSIQILRLGVVGAHELEETLGHTVSSPICRSEVDSDTDQVRSPGMIGAHYQPRTKTKLINTADLEAAKFDQALISWSIKSHPADGQLIEIPESMSDYASQIYRALHDADRHGNTEIWVEPPSINQGNTQERAIYEAVMERLKRATHA
ncbi:MAG: L-threonylcarbamoyladenylate synthase [Phycisphaerales bacterium]|nr:L-threonylcarbamoyladenylate synthase [Phycisphaerales bacterium]